MASTSSTLVNPGTIVHLRELHPSNPFFQSSGSFRVMGRLLSYDIESGLAVICEEDGTSLQVATEHLRNLHLRTGSLFQFIGELKSSGQQEIFLQARVGRNVDGIDVKLYDKALELRRQFEAKFASDIQR
eukprot:c8178_g1_i1 orf=17-406(+)